MEEARERKINGDKMLEQGGWNIYMYEDDDEWRAREKGG